MKYQIHQEKQESQYYWQYPVDLHHQQDLQEFQVPLLRDWTSDIPGMSGTLKFGIPNPPPDLDGDEPEGDPPPRPYSARVFCA